MRGQPHHLVSAVEPLAQTLSRACKVHKRRAIVLQFDVVAKFLPPGIGLDEAFGTVAALDVGHGRQHEAEVTRCAGAPVHLRSGQAPGDAAVGVLAAAKMGATPYPSIPQMGLLHGAMSDEMVEFLQGNESAEKALQDIEAAYIAKAKEQGFL